MGKRGRERQRPGGAPGQPAGPATGLRTGVCLPLPLASLAKVMMTNSSVRWRGLRWCCSSYMTRLKWFLDRATSVSLATSAFT